MTTHHPLQKLLLYSAVTTFMAGCGGSSSSTVPPAASDGKLPPQAPPAVESVLEPGTPIERTATFVSPTSQKTYKIDLVKDDREEEMRKAKERSARRFA